MAGLITSPRHTDGLHRWGQPHTPHKGIWVVIQRWELIAHLSIKECGLISPLHPKCRESPLAFSLTLVAVVSLGRGSQPLLVAEDLR